MMPDDGVSAPELPYVASSDVVSVMKTTDENTPPLADNKIVSVCDAMLPSE